MSAARASARTVATIVACLVGVVGSVPAAAGQNTATSPTLEVTDLSGVIGPAAPVPLPAPAQEPALITGSASDPDAVSARVRITNGTSTTLSELELRLEVFDRVRSRSHLAAALAGELPRRLASAEIVVARRGARGSGLEPAGSTTSTVALEGARIAWPGDGVHPVRITLHSRRAELASVTTAVVRLSRAVAEPLPTVLGWPIDAPPGAVTGHTPRLERLIDVIERRPGVTLQLLIGPHVVPELDAAGSELATRLREVSSRLAAPVAGPDQAADVARLTASGMRIDAVRHIVEGRRAVEATLASRPDPSTLWLVGPLTTGVVREVTEAAGIETVLSYGRQREGPPPLRTPSAVRRASADVLRVSADPWITPLWPRHGQRSDVLANQRLVAETAMVHLERPFDGRRSLLLLPPADWDPGAGAEAVLAALGSAPWLQLTSADGLPRPGSWSPALDPDVAPLPAGLASGIEATRRTVASLRSALGDHPAGVDWTLLGRDIDRLASRWSLNGTRPDPRRDLAAITDRLDRVIGVVDLPSDALVTLADREGVVPVTVRRTSGPPLLVSVVVHAPPRLHFPEGRRREVVLDRDDGPTTVSFRTRADATGRVPLRVEVRTADGYLVLARGQVVVRATGVNGAVVGTFAGVFAVLLGWWVRRRRRRPRAQLVVVGGERS